jgi:glyceraldehyde 3-phosphate dehydrogenase
MIPTSTGAAKAVGEVLPELSGKLDGSAIRVPTPNVSMVDLKCLLKKDVNEQEVNEVMSFAAKNELKGILEVNNLPLVSIDFNHSKASSIFDTTQTRVLENRFLRLVSWYDNEWGFSNRMLDTISVMGKLI